MPQTHWTGRILLSAGVILYVGPGASADLHAHQAVQLAWAQRGELRVTLRGRVLRRRATLIPANEPHAFDASGDVLALLLLEAHGIRGGAIDAHARASLGEEQHDALAALGFPATDATAATAAAWCDGVLAALGATPRASPLSSVSRRAVAMIEATREGVPRLQDAASAIGISSTRLTHVFTREVGVPFRRFVLWTRIKRAVTAFQGGADLTGAAVAAGFSDAAHFSRTFRAMFGLSPSLVLPVAEVIGDLWSPPR
ncbi:AraC family transcriptional regulator [Nannocystis sp. SCPEA4]|uniref:AraC family transcriptional regulator n=1 Tax=Nannocystis sp. SCPEA4 TaxID=2996787 RepID=UPI00226D5E2F|nr:AraC family transcriptional regulator [Nannocystis sp. SCPEA4]MCY1057679.1 AraC family transcriptional regulator [Nannocystis sp. SCPEA4]